MNRRELAFCAAYVECGSAPEAARKAGYSASYISDHLNWLKDRPAIQEMVSRLMDKMESKLALDASQVINQFGAIALTRPDEFLKINDDGFYCWKEPSELNERQLSAIKKITFRNNLSKQDSDGDRRVLDQTFGYTFYDKPQALTMLGNHFSIFDGSGPEKGEGNMFRNMSAEKLEQVGRAMRKAIEAPEEEPVSG